MTSPTPRSPRSRGVFEVREALVARTTGGRIAPAVIQDITDAGYLMDTNAPDGPYFEVAIIHHTDCGSRLLEHDQLRHDSAERSSYEGRRCPPCRSAAPPRRFAPTSSGYSPPLKARRTRVSGHVYDVNASLITTVPDSTRCRAAYQA